MNARTLIEAATGSTSDLARTVIKMVRKLPGVTAEEMNDADEVKLRARNDPEIAALLPEDEDEEEAVMNEVARQVDAREDRAFARKRSTFKAKASSAEDPLAHLRIAAKGKTWEEFKTLVSGDGRVLDDDTAEGILDAVYNAHRGATFSREAEWASQHRYRLSDAKDWGVWGTGNVRDSSQENDRYEQTELVRVYFGGTVPETVEVYRGVPRPDVKIKPGDYCTLDRGVARAYAKGPHGVILREKIPAKDLVVLKASRGATEMIYWPAGSKAKDRESAPITLKQLWAEANGVSESHGGRWLVTVQKFHDDTPGFVQLDLVRDGHSMGSFSPDEAIRSGADVPDLSKLETGQYWLDELT